MDLSKQLSLWAIALFAMLALYAQTASACMCMPSHPQTHFCTADYVVQLRVLRKSNTLEPGKTTYKVHIKRTYKATPEARHMLRDGRLATPNSDSMCGMQLDIGKVYIIAGRMPQLNLCNYHKEYIKMTINERHGFSGAYGKFCNCTITPCFGRHCQRQDYADSCKWSPFAKCERDFSACTPHKTRTPSGDKTLCRWRRTQLYKKCLSYP
ncbi:Timp [Drosophila busckii]|uniref:Timp n=1 Tax=Drosophila busckii TaxID=30019 RepID=A0A0M3QY46_DROBS|nr:tissue inhibitor of metalloproteinase [Drosophila busckii]ALC47043.1 Timp [Drosophila busckii]